MSRYAVGLFILLASSALVAQLQTLNNSTATPTPGVGHDYFKLFGETVNPANGSVSLRIGVPVPKGRGSDVPFAILYSSSGVHHLENFGNGARFFTETGQSVSSGWSYAAPTLTAVHNTTSYNYPGPPPATYTCDFINGYVFRDWSGSTHGFQLLLAQDPNATFSCSQLAMHTAPPGNTLYSLDTFYQAVATAGGTGYQANHTTPVSVAGPDGTVYTFGANAQCLYNALGVCSYFSSGGTEDRNGNLTGVGLILDGTTHAIWGGITDSAGRTAVSISNIAANQNTITVSGLSSPYTQVWQNAASTFAVGTLDVGSNPCSTGGIQNTTGSYVVQSLTLPNGRVFQFQYDSTYGLLKKITYPSGAYISYTWGLNTLSEAMSYTLPPNPSVITCDIRYDSPAIIQRTVSYDGVNVALQQTFGYSTTWASPSAATWLSKQTTVTTNDLIRGNNYQTIYTYSPMGFGVSGDVPQYLPEEQTIVYKDFGGNSPKTVTKGWISPYLLSCELDTLDNGATSGNWYLYGPVGQLPNTGGQMVDKREYDYNLISPSACVNFASPPGTTPTRETVIAYQTFANTPIFSTVPSILDRPSSVITNGAGTRVAETDYAYDQTATTAISAVQHDDTDYPAGTGIARGNLTTKTQKCFVGGTTCMDAVTKYSYDQTGQLASMIDPCGNSPCADMTGANHSTTYSYTDQYASGTGTPPGQTNAYLTTITRPNTGAAHTQTFTWGYADGQLRSSTDENNQATNYAYNDPFVRPTQMTYPDTGQTSFAYNDSVYNATNNTPNVTMTKAITTASLNLVSTTAMDGVGHPIKTLLTSDPEGTDYTVIVYDGLARPKSAYNPTRCNPPTTNCGGDPTYGISNYNYDALGRTISVLKQDNSAITIAYSGNCTTVTDEIGKQRKNCTDGLGRLTQVFEDPAVLNYETDYQYNALDNLLRVDQKGSAPTDSTQWRTRTFTYDSLSHLLTANNPESGTITYSYDVNGNLASKVAPQPNQTATATVTTNYQYDVLNRLMGKSYVGMSTAGAQYGYDGVAASGCTPPSLTDSYPIGRRTSMCDAAGASSWSHDKMGRTLSEKRTTSGITETLTSSYNLDGSLAAITYPSGRTVSYTPGGAGRPLAASDSNGPINYVTQATYSPPGELATAKNGASISISNTYNSRLQPNLISASTTAATILSLNYSFSLGSGDNGTVRQIINNRDNNRTQNFLYDSLDRIQQAYTNGANWGETFSPNATLAGVAPTTPGIDAWGNLTNRSGVTGKTNYEALNCPASTKNQLTTCSINYDAAGNTMSNGSATYTYDAENRLTGTGSYTYAYDGDGNRVKKQTSTLVWLYWYGASGEVLSQTNGSGGGSSEYVFFAGRRAARRDSAGNVHYYLSDHLGSTNLTTDASGNIQSESDYYPYGGEIVITGGDPDNRYKFTGKEHDSESGLDNFGARYDSSALGRFMTADSLTYSSPSDPQSLNLYNYAGNHPTSMIDPDGRCWQWAQWICDQVRNVGQRFDNLFHDEGFHTNQGVEDLAHRNNAQRRQQEVNASKTSRAAPVKTFLADAGREADWAVWQNAMAWQQLGEYLTPHCSGPDADQCKIGVVYPPDVPMEGGPVKIPGKPWTGLDAAEKAFAHLAENHGISAEVASERLHAIKAENGLGAADNVVIGKTGDVYNPYTGEWLGTLTEGGP